MAADAQTAVDAVRAFWSSIAARLPNELTLTVSPTVDQYDEANAELVGTITAATAPAPVVGTSATTYAGGIGGKLMWNTGAIVDGRRVRGATYIVPMDATTFDGTGQVSSTARTTVNTAAATLLSTTGTAQLTMQVWSRPGPPISVGDGSTASVTSGSMGTKSAILRGRRD